ncbi:MAG: DMT family transporter [Xanthomonadales bacterium]|nr:DMT family transporter [Xanthomonadales bacterium]
MTELARTRTDSAAVLSMLAGAVMISTSAPWVKVAEVAPSTSAFYRMAIGGVGLIILCLLQRRTLWQGTRYALRFVPVAIFFALDLYFWHRSIIYVGPGLATILANFQVFVLAMVGWLVFKERVPWTFFAGVLAAFAGIWLLVGVDWTQLGETYRVGVVFGLLTAVAYSAFILSMRQAQGARRTLSTPANLGIMSLICAAILAAVSWFEGHSFAVPNLKTWGALLAYGLFCQVIGWMLLTRAMPRLPAALVGLFLLLQPALSFLWDILFFARPTDRWDLVGAGLVLAGIYVANRRQTDG